MKRVATRAGPLILLLAVLLVAVGCTITTEQREELVDTVSTRVTEALAEQVEARTTDIVEKTVEKVREKAADYGVSEENVEKLAKATKDVAEEAVKDFTENKLPELVRGAVDAAVPEPREEGKENTGSTILAILYGALQLGLGLVRKGGPPV